MKKELLRLQNITISTSYNLPILNNFNLNICEGEFVSIIAPSKAAKSTLANVLTGALPFKGIAYFEEHPVKNTFNTTEIRNQIICIRNSSSLFPELSVVDNVSVIPRPSEKKFWVYRKKALLDTFRRLEALSIVINPKEKVGNLSVLDQHMITLASAFDNKVKLVIFDDTVNAYSKMELANFNCILHKLLNRGVSILCLSSKIYSYCDFADRVIYMKYGERVKTFFGDEFLDVNDLEQKMSSAGEDLSLFNLPRLARHKYVKPKIVYSADQINFNCIQPFSFKLREQDIIGILSVSVDECRLMADLFCGNSRPTSGNISLLLNNGKITSNRRIINNQTCLLVSDFAFTQSFDNLSVFQHLYPYLLKEKRLNLINPFKCLGIRKSFQQEILYNLKIPLAYHKKSIKSLDIYQRQELVLYGILLQKPRVIVCSAPFLNLDYTARSQLKHYFELYRNAGSSIIILSNISDDFIGICSYITVLSTPEKK